MTPVIEVENLTKHYRKVRAVDAVSLSLNGPGIHGLLGRNGAGKTTLMQLIAGQEFATTGHIRLFGANPVENAAVLRRTCFIKESQVYPEGLRGRHVLATGPWFYENWSHDLAAQLVRALEVPVDRQIKKMSRGQRTALGATIAIASRAELTLLDEPYAGLDPVARRLFYDALLADYTEFPRTILVSTHLVDELAGLLERVIVMDKGRILIDDDADTLRGSATALAGRAGDVAAFTAGREVLSHATLGGLATATVADLSTKDRALALSAGLELSPVSLQDLIVHRTGLELTKEMAS